MIPVYLAGIITTSAATNPTFNQRTIPYLIIFLTSNLILMLHPCDLLMPFMAADKILEVHVAEAMFKSISRQNIVCRERKNKDYYEPII